MEDPSPAVREPDVPPVRTIVLDREPVAVAPPVRERNPLRAPSPSTAGPERLSLSDLSIAYAGKPAVKSVSLSIHQGEVLALIGPSGCGKTTLLRAVADLPKQGSKEPWKLRQNYAIDLRSLRYGSLDDGAMTFKRKVRAPERVAV